MDILDRLIQISQVEGSIYPHCRFEGDWLLAHQPTENEHKGVFHIILQGHCVCHIGEQAFELVQGDILFFPRGNAHSLNGISSSVKPSSFALQEKLSNQTYQNAQTDMFCGHFYYSKQATLIETLPDMIHLSMRHSPLEQLMSLLEVESVQSDFGSQSIINSLSNVLFAYILRTYMAQHHSHQGILNALRDKRLLNVITALLKSPEQHWNMDKLAELACMSRANFIRVFQQQVGIAPGKLLVNLRMQQAAMLLAKTQKTILAVALEIGYQSESHFSKAFKKIYGFPPSVYRKTVNQV
ncbi:MAG: AraC family transcriptional regulator [Pasteurellaceae bacterium]|nr:AraC family transcriptional regulator [Pasteurellaceae bacterium]